MDELYERARRVLPGGVTANARTNAALGHPFYIARADGSRVFDMQGRPFVDLCMSNGATLLGHGHPEVGAAVRRALADGVGCAYDGASQIELAERLVDAIPSFEQVRFTTSGTEATFYALRIARAYTGKRRVLKFEGHFHGYNDALAFNFWPGPAELAPPPLLPPRAESAGMDASGAEIVVLPFNDRAALDAALARYGDELAAVILEPINYDAGAILPRPDFLAAVRAETARRGIVLIFDEILSAYRTGLSGAQGYLGVTPDLSVVGKAIGGGVPLSVFGGRRDLMAVVSPLGPAVHTGTFNAHSISIAAAHAFLDVIAQPDVFPHLLRISDRLGDGLRGGFDAAGLDVRVQWVGARMGLYFGCDPDVEVTSYRQVAGMDLTLRNAFCAAMHRHGVFVAPVWHHGVSVAHQDADIDMIVAAASASAHELAQTEFTTKSTKDTKN